VIVEHRTARKSPGMTNDFQEAKREITDAEDYGLNKELKARRYRVWPRTGRSSARVLADGRFPAGRSGADAQFG